MEEVNVLATVRELMLSDDEDEQKQSDRIKNDYEALSTSERGVVDNIFISLCGYSLATILAGEAT